jgi:hypothetical protein
MEGYCAGRWRGVVLATWDICSESKPLENDRSSLLAKKDEISI